MSRSRDVAWFDRRRSLVDLPVPRRAGKRLSALLLVSALWTQPGAVVANGFSHAENGTVPLGRGGAFVARASDGSAVAHNLAGLAGQRGTRVTLLSSFSDLHRCFTRAGEYPRTAGVAAGTPYAAAGAMCDSRGLLEGVGPLLAVSTDLGRARGPVFALGVFGPSGLHRTTYTQGGRDTDEPALVHLRDAAGKERVTWAPSRYDLVDDQLEVLYVTPAVAFEVAPGLRVAASLQWVFARLSFTTYGALLADDPGGLAIRNRATAVDPFTPAAVVAVQARPLRTLEIGASFRWSAGLDAAGDLEIGVTRLADGREQFLGRDRVGIDLSVGQAAELRTGVRWWLPGRVRPVGDPMVDEVLDLELDWVFETNSAIEAITIRSDDPIRLCGSQGEACMEAPPVGRVGLPHRFRDTHALRAGGDWNVLPGRLAVRAGASWESAAAPDSLTLLDFAAFERFGLHAGATVRLGMLDLSVAAAHLFHESRTVEHGAARVASPSGLCDPAADPSTCITNEGRHASSIDMISASASVRFR